MHLHPAKAEYLIQIDSSFTGKLKVLNLNLILAKSNARQFHLRQESFIRNTQLTTQRHLTSLFRQIHLPIHQ